MDETILFRRFRPADAQKVSTLICRNFFEVNAKDYPQKELERLAAAHRPEDISQRANAAHFYVACRKELVIACGAIAPYFDRKDESILLSIFVLPEEQGKGIGRQIIEILEQDLYFKRARRIEIPASITACAFYQKLGYQFKNGVHELDEQRLYRLEQFRNLAEKTEDRG